MSNVLSTLAIGLTGAIAAGSMYLLHFIARKQVYQFTKKKPEILEISSDPDSPAPPPILTKILKEVPLLIYEQTAGFADVQEKLGTLVDIQAFPLLDLYGAGSGGGSGGVVPIETVNNYYKYIQIEGYPTDVQAASKAIDELITAASQHFELISLRSSQIRAMTQSKCYSNIIHGIERETGVRLVIGEYDPNHRAPYTTVQIIGDEAAIVKAYGMLEGHLEDNGSGSGPRSWSGRNGGNGGNGAILIGGLRGDFVPAAPASTPEEVEPEALATTPATVIEEEINWTQSPGTSEDLYNVLK